MQRAAGGGQLVAIKNIATGQGAALAVAIIFLRIDEACLPAHAVAARLQVKVVAVYGVVVGAQHALEVLAGTLVGVA